MENSLPSATFKGSFVASIEEKPQNAHASKGGACVDYQEPSKRLHRYP